MKKLYKILFVFFIIISIYFMAYNISAKNIWSTANSFINKGANSSNGLIEDAIGNIGDAVMKKRFEELIDFLWGLGLLVIFISTVVLGIKYMLVLPNEKSRLKQATTPYIIGVIIIFGALTIWKLVIEILESGM